MNNLTIEKSDYAHKIKASDIVIRTDLGKYSKLTFVANPSKSISIKKLNKHEYVDLNTNEIKQYNLNKPTNKSDVNRKLKKYEEIVIANFTGGASELFLTLTCKENITDISIIKQYYNNFISSIKKDYADLDYIALFEQTAEWCWHIHLFIKNNQHKKLFIPHQELLDYWRQGAVYVMPNKNTFRTLGHSKEKRDNRLERLTYYPKGEKLYHKSKGIKIPTKEKMTYKECPEYNSVEHTRISSKTYTIKNQDNDKVVNTIATEIYKQTTSKNQDQDTTKNDNNALPTPQVKRLTTKELEKKSKVRQMIERQKQASERIFWEFF